MNEKRRDFVLALAGASALLALDLFLPQACTQKSVGGDASPPSVDNPEDASIS